MRLSNRRQKGKGALELIEEAVHLLRSSSASSLAVYYAGTLPFLLGLLFFWADMSHSAFARRHIAETSLVVAVLFLWMKFWQAVFAIRVRAQFAGETPERLDFARCRRIFLTQTAIQPIGLFLLPLAFIAAIPFPWGYAFCQNVTALADSGETLHSRCGKSWRQAALWPGQNHVLLGFMLLFGFFVFLNCVIASLVLPELVKMLFGIETVFTRAGAAMLNTTFFAATLGLTYACVDPILKTIYTLRCFYGESLQSGEDLKAELKQYAVPAQRLAACIVTLLLLSASSSFSPLSAAETSDVQKPIGRTESSPSESGAVPRTPSGVSPAELDRAITETLEQRKYSWRMPREKEIEVEREQGAIARFFQRVSTMVRKWMRAVRDWLEDLFDRRNHSRDRGDSGFGWIWSLDILLYVLLAATLCATAIFLMRHWRRKRTLQPVAAQAIQSAPDLADENVGAEQLPEDGWTKLARELFARGEFRLALRAFYLASLAHLAGKNLISLARFKSNRDYENELRRRGHSFPDLLVLFTDNVDVFDRSWYGLHEVSSDVVNQFAAKVERIKGAG
jgi:hypothetical protein